MGVARPSVRSRRAGHATALGRPLHVRTDRRPLHQHPGLRVSTDVRQRRRQVRRARTGRRLAGRRRHGSVRLPHRPRPRPRPHAAVRRRGPRRSGGAAGPGDGDSARRTAAHAGECPDRRRPRPARRRVPEVAGLDAAVHARTARGRQHPRAARWPGRGCRQSRRDPVSTPRRHRDARGTGPRRAGRAGPMRHRALIGGTVRQPGVLRRRLPQPRRRRAARNPRQRRRGVPRRRLPDRRARPPLRRSTPLRHHLPARRLAGRRCLLVDHPVRRCRAPLRQPAAPLRPGLAPDPGHGARR